MDLTHDYCIIYLYRLYRLFSKNYDVYNNIITYRSVFLYDNIIVSVTTLCKLLTLQLQHCAAFSYSIIIIWSRLTCEAVALLNYKITISLFTSRNNDITILNCSYRVLVNGT